MVSSLIAHYRPKCVADFSGADPGSVNLRQYAEDFADAQRIRELRERLDVILGAGIGLDTLEEVTMLTRKLDHEVNRAVFPYRYVDYATSIFGSARIAEDDPEYKEVVAIACGIVSEIPAHINTGGGPAIMAAASEGLKRAAELRRIQQKLNRARNAGLLIKLPSEEFPNQHLDIHSRHSTFGTRLNEFADRGNSAISGPGGGGTDLENAFLYQLKQVRHLEMDYPVILKGDIWRPIQEAKMEAMYHRRREEGKKELISPGDLDLMTFYDNPDDAIQMVLDHYERWKKNVWSKLDGESQEMVVRSVAA